jgi:hypothetical protein
MALFKNNTNENSKIGLICKQDPKDPKAFIYATSSDTNVLGVITQSVPKYAQCEIQSSGVARVMVSDNTVQGSTIRLQKAGDNISRATCKTAKSTDTPYLQIGTALQSGKGLINVALNISYAGNVGAVADGTYTIGLGFLTDGVIVIEKGIVKSIQEAT